MIARITAATRSGSHPPCATLMMLAPKYARSKNRKPPVTSPATSSFQPQILRATKNASRVVMTIVVVTATPYALARLVVEPNPITIATVAIMSARFTAGM